MKTYEFSIVASGLDPKADDFEQRFYDVGCDDATISFQKGHVIVDFAREADTAQAAIESAFDAVRRAGAVVDRVEPDPLVTLSDIASRVGITKAAVSQYANEKRQSGFPAPAARVTSSSSLWLWAEVVEWFVTNRVNQSISEEALTEAKAIAGANEKVRVDRDCAPA